MKKWKEQRREVKEVGALLAYVHWEGGEIPYSFYRSLGARFSVEEIIALECYTALHLFCQEDVIGEMTPGEMDAKIEEVGKWMK